jgi:uncharacterized protein (DUF1684 family)
MTSDADYALSVADWRRQVHDLYGAVRAQPDPQAAHELWVAGRCDLFDHHPASARMARQSLRHAPYDPAYRFVLPIDSAAPDAFEFSTGTDGVVPFSRIGVFTLPELGSLDVWWLGSYGNGLFLPLRDTTAGSTTYGAGRYLLDTVKGADLGRDASGNWVLDLNFAYNPSCVYNPEWACPLAPAGNRLTGAVPVGELLPTGY